MKDGEFPDEASLSSGGNVVAIGSTVADELFGGTGVPPIGQVIKVRKCITDTAAEFHYVLLG